MTDTPISAPVHQSLFGSTPPPKPTDTEAARRKALHINQQRVRHLDNEMRRLILVAIKANARPGDRAHWEAYRAAADFLSACAEGMRLEGADPDRIKAVEADADAHRNAANASWDTMAAHLQPLPPSDECPITHIRLYR